MNIYWFKSPPYLYRDLFNISINLTRHIFSSIFIWLGVHPLVRCFINPVFAVLHELCDCTLKREPDRPYPKTLVAHYVCLQALSTSTS